MPKNDNPYWKYIMELDIGFYRIATDGVILEHNPAFSSILGYKAGENLTGISVLDFWENQQERIEYLEEIMKKGHVRNYVIRSRTKDNRSIAVQLNSHLERDKNGYSLWIEGTLNDITKLKKYEESLQQFQARFDALLSSTTDEIFLIDNEGKLLIANEALARNMGKTKEALEGINVFNVRLAELSRSRKKQIDKMKKTRKAINFQDEYNGCWFDNHYFPVFDPEGKITGTAIFSRDITDKRMAEEALKSSEERFKIIFEHAPDSIYIHDMNGVILDANKQCENITGYKREELIGKNLFEFGFLDPEGYEKAMELLKNVLHSNDIGTHDFEITRKNGSKVHLEVIAYSVLLGSEKVVLGVARDTSEFYHAKEMLERSRHILREAQRISGLGTYELDIASGEWTSSDMLNVIFGIDEQYKKNIKSWLKLVHPDHRREMTNYLYDVVLKQKKAFDKEYRIKRHNNKETRWVHGIGELEYNDQGNPVRMIGTIQDITQKKATEEKINLYQKKLRQLNSQLMRTEEMERRRIAVNIHDYISQSLAIAKIKLTTLKNQLNSEKTINEINEITSSISDAIRNSRIITSELSPPILFELGLMAALNWKLEQIEKIHGIHTLLLGDLSEFDLTEDEQILLFRVASELIMNTVKHAQAKQLFVKVKANTKQMILEVRDDGRGFYAEQIMQRTEKQEGFGLFSIKERIEQLGGKFQIRSILEKGTTITIQLNSETKSKVR